ncbi:helix-turn-helix transcriptional regulator [Gracilibacillus saliphilus]|uniref:helix-turn-helix transcriptional regulator n=1 Tax=Gracilibacillus saliphilus TaxID=543890 RepID=UPI0013D3C116|nr:helix-turn-helix transcriptional regulator [Gracilibacillus saliphilus]
MNENKFGDFLRKYRKEYKCSLREMSDKTGISFSHLSKIERGEYNPSRRTVEIIAEKLNLDSNELLPLAGFNPNGLGEGLDAFFPKVDKKRIIFDDDTQELIDMLQDVPEEKRKEMLEYFKAHVAITTRANEED